jgi:hypothetical protein
MVRPCFATDDYTTHGNAPVHLRRHAAPLQAHIRRTTARPPCIITAVCQPLSPQVTRHTGRLGTCNTQLPTSTLGPPEGQQQKLVLTNRACRWLTCSSQAYTATYAPVFPIQQLWQHFAKGRNTLSRSKSPHLPTPKGRQGPRHLAPHQHSRHLPVREPVCCAQAQRRHGPTSHPPHH